MNSYERVEASLSNMGGQWQRPVGGGDAAIAGQARLAAFTADVRPPVV